MINRLFNKYNINKNQILKIYTYDSNSIDHSNISINVLSNTILIISNNENDLLIPNGFYLEKSNGILLLNDVKHDISVTTQSNSVDFCIIISYIEKKILFNG